MVPQSALNNAVALQLELDVHRETLDRTRDLVDGLGGINRALASDNPEVVHQATQYKESSIALRQHRTHQTRLGLKSPVPRASKHVRQKRQVNRQHSALSRLYATLAPVSTPGPDSRSSKQVYRPNLKRWENPKFGVACDPDFPLQAGPEPHTFVGPVAHSGPQGPLAPPQPDVNPVVLNSPVVDLAGVKLGASTGPSQRAAQAEATIRAEVAAGIVPEAEPAPVEESDQCI